MPNSPRSFVTGEIYHLYNRGINRQPTFTSKREYQRAIAGLEYYRYSDAGPGLATYSKISEEGRHEVRARQEDSGMTVSLLAYCLMPNHFHILLRQCREDGITIFMSQWQNSYTRYFNVAHQRSGPLFTGPFKAVRIEDQSQLLHVSRYIHLNPYSSFVLDSVAKLESYEWSSLPEYLDMREPKLAEVEQIMESFGSPNRYRQFVFDHADYQRKLKSLRAIVLEPQQ